MPIIKIHSITKHSERNIDKQANLKQLVLIVLFCYAFGFGCAQKNRGMDRQQSIFYTTVPSHPYDLILSRPSNNSITLSVLCNEEMDGFIEYGLQADKLSEKTINTHFEKGKLQLLEITSLQADTRYYYRFAFSNAGEASRQSSPIGLFHTQRATDKPFMFTIQADSHLDENCSVNTYQQTLKNMAADSADFLVDLGDTWMTDKYRDNYRTSLQQYIAQRYYFDIACKSTPLFLTLGNHDGELGTTSVNNEMMAWSVSTRTSLYANPFPDHFYSGNDDRGLDGKFIEDYYAWQWGNALFIVLDPFRYTTDNRNPWQRSLGQKQYNWLKSTLENSKAKFKFVFIHNLVGGVDNSGIARGGAEAAKFYEWGGMNSDGSNGFAANRTGWEKPIHDLLVQHKVNVVFHGHDHLFAKQELDGVIYQLVPQPGAMGFGNTNSAKEYGYIQGTILNAPGYLRVSVNANETVVEFVQTNVEVASRNKTVLFSYKIN
jgi:UDP-2,3-diacylglucosamine pyrophosphatase LpxH